MSSSRTFVLQSCDGVTFKVEEEVASQSKAIWNLIDDDCADDVIPLPNVKGRTLVLVIKYCKRHVNPPPKHSANQAYQILKEWDKEFVKVDQDTLFDLIMAAHYLDITELLDLTCQTVADMMKGKSPKQIREIFGIKKDYTKKEEAEVLRENSWAFEGYSKSNY